MNSSYVKNGSQSHSSLLTVRAVEGPRNSVEDNELVEESVEDVVIESEEVFVGTGVRSYSGSGSSSSGTYFTATEEKEV